MKNYKKALLEQLIQYKRNHLHIEQDGEFKNDGKTRPHILPEEIRCRNIIKPYMFTFFTYLGRLKALGHPVALHSDFHHLNSSQAMCFNLFYPFMREGKVEVLCKLLGIEGTGEAVFEHVEEDGPGKENSHIDFWINLESGGRVVMELKLSESDFGGASFNLKSA